MERIFPLLLQRSCKKYIFHGLIPLKSIKTDLFSRQFFKIIGRIFYRNA